MPKTNKLPIVIVQWRDITNHEDAWVALERVQQAGQATILSVGWLVHEDEASLRIAMDLSEDGLVNTLAVIPKLAVVWSVVRPHPRPPRKPKEEEGDEQANPGVQG